MTLHAVTEHWHSSDDPFSGQTNGHEVESPLTYAEAAAFLKITVRQLKVLVAQGKVPCLDYGHRTKRFEKQALIRAGKSA